MRRLTSALKSSSSQNNQRNNSPVPPTTHELMIKAIDQLDLPAVESILSGSDNIAYKLSGNVEKALFHATKKGNLAIVDVLYRSRAIDLNILDDNQQTLFFTACAAGHVEIAQYFIGKARELNVASKLVDINALNRDNESALFIACQNNRFKVVEYFLTFPQTPSILHKQNFNGMTPFSIACSEGHVEVVQLLLKLPESFALKVNQQFAEQKLPEELGSDEPTEVEGHTALYMACKNGYPNVVEVLLKDQRVNINLTNRRNETPFYAACEGGKIHVLRKFQAKESFNFIEALITPTPRGIYPATWVLCQSLEFDFVKKIVNLLLQRNECKEIIAGIFQNFLTLKTISPPRQHMICMLQAKLTGEPIENFISQFTAAQQTKINEARKLALSNPENHEVKDMNNIVALFPPFSRLTNTATQTPQFN